MNELSKKALKDAKTKKLYEVDVKGLRTATYYDHLSLNIEATDEEHKKIGALDEEELISLLYYLSEDTSLAELYGSLDEITDEEQWVENQKITTMFEVGDRFVCFPDDIDKAVEVEPARQTVVLKDHGADFDALVREAVNECW